MRANQPAVVANGLRSRTPAPTKAVGLTGIGTAEGILLAAMVAAFVFLLLRNLGLHPSVFSDEWSYSMSSRQMKLGAATTPLYLYYFVYRVTRHCGIEFLECARVLNALFFVAAAPLIFSVAKKVTGKFLAAFISILSLIAPVNIYTAYFMPEALYFFVFWILTWFVLECRQVTPARYGGITGALLGLLMLVKVNAVFLVPGVAAFLLYRYLSDGSSSRPRPAIIAVTYMIVAAAVIRLGIGYLCAGTAGLHVLGVRYGSLADSSMAPAHLSQMTGHVLGVLRGHIMGLAVLFGVPLADMVTIASRRRNEHKDEECLKLQAIAVYAILQVAILLVVVAYFTVSVMSEGPYESLARLHMRYYDFLFPLFLIVVAGQISSRESKRNPYVVGISVVVFAVLIVYSLKSLLALYSPSPVDSPELYGATSGRTAFFVIAVLGIISVMVWAVNQRRGTQLFLFVFTPVSLLCSVTVDNSYLRGQLKGDAYDRAGVFARDELDRDERSKLVVVGSELAALYRVLFYVDEPKATLLSILPGAPLDPSAIPVDREWVLLMGDHAVPADVTDQSSGDGYVLFRVPDASGKDASVAHTVNFSHTFRFGLVKRVSGLSVEQPFGRWSDGREVQIEMFSPLPASSRLCLAGKAFGPNVGRPFAMRVGDETRQFRLTAAPREVCLAFQTDGNQRLISIAVPRPTSPKQMGIDSDERMLGLGLTQMKIITESATSSGANPRRPN